MLIVAACVYAQILMGFDSSVSNLQGDKGDAGAAGRDVSLVQPFSILPLLLPVWIISLTSSLLYSSVSLSSGSLLRRSLL